MSFEADLKSHLQADATLTALVADRITPVIREQGAALPAVTYQLVAADEVPNLDGRDASLRNLRVQIDAWALSHFDALTIELAVRSRMDTAASTFNSVPLPGGAEDYESDTRIYRRMMEFSTWYRAT